MAELNQILVQRLRHKGMDLCLIPGFIRSLANSFFVDPRMNLLQVNNRLHYLGWKDVDLDYHTFQLALACFESAGIESLHSIPAHIFEKDLNGILDN